MNNKENFFSHTPEKNNSELELEYARLAATLYKESHSVELSSRMKEIQTLLKKNHQEIMQSVGKLTGIEQY